MGVGDRLPARMADGARVDAARGRGLRPRGRARRPRARPGARPPPRRGPRGRRRCSSPAGAPRGARWRGTPRATRGVEALSRTAYLAGVRSEDNAQAWGVWLVIGLSVAFAALALVNTAAMATAERRGSSPRSASSAARPGRRRAWSRSSSRRWCWSRCSPGRPSPAWRSWACRTASAASRSSVPAALAAGLAGGAALLGLAAAAVTARLALRASPAAAMRAQE